MVPSRIVLPVGVHRLAVLPHSARRGLSAAARSDSVDHSTTSTNAEVRH